MPGENYAWEGEKSQDAEIIGIPIGPGLRYKMKVRRFFELNKINDKTFPPIYTTKIRIIYLPNIFFHFGSLQIFTKHVTFPVFFLRDVLTDLKIFITSINATLSSFEFYRKTDRD